MASKIKLAMSEPPNRHLTLPKIAIPVLVRPHSEALKERFPQFPSSSHPSSLQKRSRRGTPKARTGCQTCKIRHKKCDETKPACIQCTNSQRKCDFVCDTINVPLAVASLSGPSSLLRSSGASHARNFFKLSSPLFSFKLSEQDGQHYQHFVRLATSNFLTAVQAPIWSVILQVSQTEPSIRHVALACGTLHKIHPYIVANPSDPCYIALYHSAVRHYATSVEMLKSRLDEIQGKADLASWEVTLLAAFLFTSFEALIGNENGAHWHNISALKLMKSAMETYGPVEKPLDLPGNLPEIVIGMNRRDIQVSTFGLGYETQVLLVPYVPEAFTSLDEASNSLDSIIPNILSSIRLHDPEWYGSRSPTSSFLDKGLESRIQCLKTVLQRWLDTFQAFRTFRTSLKSGSPKFKLVQELIACNTLLIQYWTAYVWLHTPYSSAQTVHDPYFKQFATITELAQHILILRPDRKYQFSADNEIVYPLFYVAQKCRDGALRRKAVELLTRSGREGVWDGPCIAAVASWIIDMEEGGLQQGIPGSVVEGDVGFVEEGYRLRGCLIEANRLAKAMTVSAQRLDENGKGYWVSGKVTWGKVNTVILYGEPENLWHKGQLFG